MSAFCLRVRKGHDQLYQILNAHSAKGADQLNLETYLGISHLSGVSVSFLIILWSEMDQSSYLHVNMSQLYKKVYECSLQ